MLMLLWHDKTLFKVGPKYLTRLMCLSVVKEKKEKSRTEALLPKMYSPGCFPPQRIPADTRPKRKMYGTFMMTKPWCWA